MTRFKVIHVEFCIETSFSDFEFSHMNEYSVIQNLVEYRSLKVEILLRQYSSFGAHLDWNIRKVCVCRL